MLLFSNFASMKSVRLYALPLVREYKELKFINKNSKKYENRKTNLEEAVGRW